MYHYIGRRESSGEIRGFCFLSYRKDLVALKRESIFLSYKRNNNNRTVAERNMSLKRPAAGGESCAAGFFFYRLEYFR